MLPGREPARPVQNEILALPMSRGVGARWPRCFSSSSGLIPRLEMVPCGSAQSGLAYRFRRGFLPRDERLLGHGSAIILAGDKG